ncbi:MAG: GTP 3',8-cyclase MoaA [Planctomycetota bacterium]
MTTSLDQFGRRVDYLRISITDRCNERCRYCMPEGFNDWLPRQEILTYGEMKRIVRVAVDLGFKRFRMTGGEPLVRKGAADFIEDVCSMDGVEHVALTTNAMLLAPVARRLKDAGLGSVNISLDSLDAERYKAATRGDLGKVMDGITAAVEAGFESIKLNAVLMKGGEEDLWPLVKFGAEHGMAVRFIELMPISDPAAIGEDYYLSTTDARAILGKHDTLTALPHAKLGAGPARYYKLEKLGATVGFISAMSDDHFCETCNKMRLTADGFIRPCLGNHGEIDMKPALREHRLDEDKDAAVKAIFEKSLAEKPKDHVFRDEFTPLRIMTAIGG